jgi:hypothetical protein
MGSHYVMHYCITLMVLQIRINFLGVTIQKTQNKFTFNVYRKPTTTDSIIPNDSRHPQEHKHAAVSHMLNRMHTYNLNKTDKKK